MSSADRINKKNGLWRRMSEGFSRSSMSRLLRSFRSALICGKPSDVASSPVYTGPIIVHVPWSGETYQYGKDRYLSNDELKSQLEVLEMRFHAQSRRLNGSVSEERRKLRMAIVAEARQEQFDRLEGLVNDLQKQRAME